MRLHRTAPHTHPRALRAGQRSAAAAPTAHKRCLCACSLLPVGAAAASPGPAVVPAAARAGGAGRPPPLLPPPRLWRPLQPLPPRPTHAACCRAPVEPAALRPGRRTPPQAAIALAGAACGSETGRAASLARPSVRGREGIKPSAAAAGLVQRAAAHAGGGVDMCAPPPRQQQQQ